VRLGDGVSQAGDTQVSPGAARGIGLTSLTRATGGNIQNVVERSKVNETTKESTAVTVGSGKPIDAVVQVGPTPTVLGPGNGALTVPGSAYLKKTPATGAFRRWAVISALFVGATCAAGYWFTHRPVEVTIIRPTMTSVIETIASSGLVGGVKESVIGASFNGAVLRLQVKLGDHVQAGEALAVLKNNITQAQVVQAETAVVAARAQLTQTSRGALPSELQVAQMQVSQARAVTEQNTADLNLARATQDRTQALAKDGLVPKSELETANAAFAAAAAKVRAGTASVRLAEAQLQTLRGTPRKEDVELARDRLTEAQQALLVVRQQAGEATVTAPFTGTITAVNVEVGQNVDALGLFGLVSDELEIRIDLDESNLADISLGQKALLTKAIVPGDAYPGVPRITRLLRLVGDLPAAADVSADGTIYDAALVDAVKKFQGRHGRDPNGRIGAQTLADLNVPLSRRVQQMELVLERWRWMPQAYQRAPIIVNIPEFRLRAYDKDFNVAVTMNVVVGNSARVKHFETPGMRIY